ncbi:MAG TPA: hypothetical protein VHX38_17315 [Pseudonocardiaceae bacterium]|jgi:hypothetical protein|nr:hypothetical protein [Pseudonocardiaceae bacterium]
MIAAFRTVGGIIPCGISKSAMRALHHVGQFTGLDGLLACVDRTLVLVLEKLHAAFGSGFEDEIIKPVTSHLKKILMSKGKLTDYMFQVPDLLTRCDSAISSMPVGQIDARQVGIYQMYVRFNKWNMGFDVAGTSLKWGSRIAVISPPIKIAFAAVQAALAAGAFLTGRHYLDSPRLNFLPLRTLGVLAILENGAEQSPRSERPVIKGDDLDK